MWGQGLYSRAPLCGEPGKDPDPTRAQKNVSALLRVSRSEAGAVVAAAAVVAVVAAGATLAPAPASTLAAAAAAAPAPASAVAPAAAVAAVAAAGLGRAAVVAGRRGTGPVVRYRPLPSTGERGEDGGCHQFGVVMVFA